MPGSTASVSNSAHWLVVGVNWIGDAIMTLPAIQAWRREHAGARLTVLVRPALAPLWALHDAPTSVLRYTEKPWRALCDAARVVRGAAVDRAVILPNSFRSALVPFLARVPRRIGRAGQWRRGLLTDPLPALTGEPVHQSLEYYDLMELARPLAGPELPRLNVPSSAKDAVRERLRDIRHPVLGVMPGAARGPAKRWPIRHFASVSERWRRETGGDVLVLGAAVDAAAGAEILRVAGGGLNLAGQTGFPEWAACLEACAAVVCNDSGGMHLAAALGRPVVAVFGSTDPRVTGPLGPAVRVVTDEGPRSRAIDRADPEAEKRLAAILPEQVYEVLAHALPS